MTNSPPTATAPLMASPACTGSAGAEGSGETLSRIEVGDDGEVDALGLGVCLVCALDVGLDVGLGEGLGEGLGLGDGDGGGTGRCHGGVGRW